MGNQEAIIVEEAQSPEDFNMGSSSSSQYTFCQPETGKNCIKNTLMTDLSSPVTTFYIYNGQVFNIFEIFFCKTNY